MRSDLRRLQDMLDALQKILPYAEDKKAFFEDELVRVYVVYQLQLVGEAAARTSETLRRSETSLPWQDMIAMRNILVHRYFGIDWNEVYNTLAIDVPQLHERLRLCWSGSSTPHRASGYARWFVRWSEPEQG